MLLYMTYKAITSSPGVPQFFTGTVVYVNLWIGNKAIIIYLKKTYLSLFGNLTNKNKIGNINYPKTGNRDSDLILDSH